ncbi:MFS transporter [Leucobacter celer]|uniref:MFS transporter n=1 Tax=Leucobacter celer TaxID=668625 RepID=UPI0006A7C950|nr:MFS transporter [Leucobacter celer]
MREDVRAAAVESWKAIAIAAAVTVVCSLPLYLIGALAPQINADLPLDASDVGAVLAGYWVAGALGSFVSVRWAGLLTDRAAMTISLAIVAFGLLAAALFARQSWHLLALIGLTGFANGTGHSPANSQLQLRLPEGLQGLGFGIKQAAIPLASVIAGLSVPLLGATIGWRFAFAAGAVLCIPISAVVLAAVRSEPKPGVPGGGASAPRMPGSVRRKAIRLSIVTLFAAGAFAAATTLATTAADLRDWPIETAALALAGASLVGAICRVIASAIPGLSLRQAWGLLLLILALGAAGMLIMSIPIPAAFYLGMLLAQGPGWAWPGIMHFVGARLAEGHVGAVTGVIQGMVSISSALVPLLTGALLVGFGVTFSWIVLFLLLAVSVSWGFSIWRTRGFFPTSPVID